MTDDIVDRFVESWGAMGAFWGLSASVARVHALLLITDRPWSLDEIAGRLRISKGNVSMSLKELRVWRVVRREPRPGDRREFYTTEPDAWQMFFSIARERKRREFDPLVESVRAVLEQAKGEPRGLAVERMRKMGEMLSTLDKAAERLLKSGEQARAVITFVLGK